MSWEAPGKILSSLPFLLSLLEKGSSGFHVVSQGLRFCGMAGAMWVGPGSASLHSCFCGKNNRFGLWKVKDLQSGHSMAEFSAVSRGVWLELVSWYSREGLLWALPYTVAEEYPSLVLWKRDRTVTLALPLGSGQLWPSPLPSLPCCLPEV